jgi:hypothetical protein
VTTELLDDLFERQLAESAVKELTEIIQRRLPNDQIAHMTAGLVIGRLHKLEQERKQ